MHVHLADLSSPLTGGYDLDAVAGGEPCGGPRALRHKVPVTRCCDLRRAVAELGQQLRQRPSAGRNARAIDHQYQTFSRHSHTRHFPTGASACLTERNVGNLCPAHKAQDRRPALAQSAAARDVEPVSEIASSMTLADDAGGPTATRTRQA